MKNKSFPSYFCLILLLFFTSCDKPKWSFNLGIPEFQSGKTETIKSPDFPARVIRILDGDTLEVMYGELPVMIRLAHIDCPEIRSSQPFGKKAKQTLSDLCFGQIVEIEFSGEKDRNGRYICVIFNESDINVNQEMLKLGMAWHYKKYSTDEESERLEEEARQSKIGLWADTDPTPPWQWRK